MFDDWAGTFYPMRVPQSKWLEYYAARFPVGELNSTYYRIAPESAYASISRRTPPEFRLFAKVHADVTHKREDPETSLSTLLGALEPLRKDGKLIGLLAQFPASFRYSPVSMTYLRRVRDHCGDTQLCVEFRHRSWASDIAIREVKECDLTWVSPDEPLLPDLMPHQIVDTSDSLYLRLHGQNAAAWYNREVGDRYDYEYSTEQLTALGNELLAADAKRAYVFFNNCYAGKAARNAWWLKSWFSAVGQNEGDLGPINGFTLSTN